MSGTFDPSPKALVALYGYGDLIGDWLSKLDSDYLKERHISREEALEQVESKQISENRRPGRFYLYTRQQGTWPQEVGGVDPERDPGFFTRYCPEQIVSSDYPPTLLLHGTKDTDVPYEQSVMMRDRLHAAGVEHELITLDSGHAFLSQWWNPEVQDANAQN